MLDESPRGAELRSLKARGQKLKPVVQVGRSGLSGPLLASVERALADHELIKVKFDAPKGAKDSFALDLAAQTRSHLVQRVGNVAVLYRPPPAQDSGAGQLTGNTL